MPKKGKKRCDTPPRPTTENEAVIQNGILAFCRQFKEYDAAQLLEVWGNAEDGYSLARALERYGLHPNDETVLDLGQLEAFIGDALLDAEKVWVRENHIQLTIQRGQQVSFPWSDGEKTGVIAGTDPERAIYLVKRDGDTNPNRTAVIFAERVKVIIDCCNDGAHKPWPCPACGIGPCLHSESSTN